MDKKQIDNPFFHNYVFKNFDYDRVKISKLSYPLLWFLTTYVQLSEGYVFYYKQWRNRYYLMKVEPHNYK